MTIPASLVGSGAAVDRVFRTVLGLEDVIAVIAKQVVFAVGVEPVVARAAVDGVRAAGATGDDIMHSSASDSIASRSRGDRFDVVSEIIILSGSAVIGE